MTLFLRSVLFISLTITMVFLPTAKADASEDQKSTIQSIQNYLNRIGTLRANFTQTNPNGIVTTGKIYLNRLGKKSFGKMRLDYNPPSYDQIIADGEILRFIDGQTKDVSEYSIDSTPASFLLRHKIDLFKDFEIKNLATRENRLFLTIIRADDDGATLTLIFETSPLLRLQEWSLIDAQSNETHVALAQVETDIPLDDRLFRL